MKIMSMYHQDIPFGWGRVLTAVGHNFVFWQPQTKSPFDAFNEFEPDIFIGVTSGICPAIIKCLATRPNVKTALSASPWKQATQQERMLVRRLKEETGRPDFVFANTEAPLEQWQTLGLFYAPILPSADTFDYRAGTADPSLACDIAFVGDCNEHILRLCDPNSKYKVKVFGGTGWPVHQYLGLINASDVANLYASATISPNAGSFERPFQVLASGGFCVSDDVDGLRKVFSKGQLPIATTKQQFQKLIDHYLNKPDERLPFIEKGKADVMAHHTCYERVAQVFECLGLTDEALKVKQRKL